MNKLIRETKIKKAKGFLYYIDKKGDVSRAKLSRGNKKAGKAEKVAKVGVKKIAGYLYFLDKKGNVSATMAIRGNQPGKGTKSGGPRRVG